MVRVAVYMSGCERVRMCAGRFVSVGERVVDAGCRCLCGALHSESKVEGDGAGHRLGDGVVEV